MEVMKELQIALHLDSNDSDVHRILAAVYLTLAVALAIGMDATHVARTFSDV